MRTREVTWGEAIVVETFKAGGGLRAVVDRIIATIGPQVGSRNTFAKLYQVIDPETLTPRDRWRGWLLLAALGQEPAAWGIGDDVVPSAFDVDRLKCAIRDSNPEPADVVPLFGGDAA